MTRLICRILLRFHNQNDMSRLPPAKVTGGALPRALLYGPFRASSLATRATPYSNFFMRLSNASYLLFISGLPTPGLSA